MRSPENVEKGRKNVEKADKYSNNKRSIFI